MSNLTTTHTGRVLVTGQTATGTNQATALPLPGRAADIFVEFTSVPSSTGCLLPPINLPCRVEIANGDTNTLSVYPQSGGTINNGSANAAVTITAGNAAVFEASSLLNWYTVGSTAASGGGSGTVTSVTFTGDGTVLSSTPSSAVTSSGTLDAALATQSANKILAGPTTGSAAAPTFRSLVTADLPGGAAGITQLTGDVTTPSGSSG